MKIVNVITEYDNGLAISEHHDPSFSDACFKADTELKDIVAQGATRREALVNLLNEINRKMIKYQSAFDSLSEIIRNGEV